jgi:hypothetical protein
LKIGLPPVLKAGSSGIYLKNLICFSSYIFIVAELKPGAIAWAKWNRKGSNLMWPCVIENIQIYKNKKSGAKVSFRFYEYSEEVIIGNVFKSDSSDIELFFRTSKNHFEYKVINVFVITFSFFNSLFKISFKIE